MVPKVEVPTDFGIENLHCQFHGNVLVKLAGEETMRANSVILSFHSLEFVRLFSELKQSTLELDEFLPGAVKSFIAALYCGQVEMDKFVFRDINKMSYAFKVSWLISICSKFYKDLVSSVTALSDFDLLIFLFEEARYVSKSLKCDSFIDMIVEKIASFETHGEIFVHPYMANYSELKIDQLHLMIRITRRKPLVLLKIVKQIYEQQKLAFDKNTIYILQNIDLYQCMCADDQLFEALFDLLLEESEGLSCDDVKSINTLYRGAVRTFKIGSKMPPGRSSRSSTAVASPRSPVTLRSPIPTNSLGNVFSSFEDFGGLGIHGFLDAAARSPKVRNLYSLYEGLFRLSFEGKSSFITPVSVIEKVKLIRKRRGWKRMSLEFFKNVYYNTDFFNLLLQHDEDLYSTDENVQVIGRGFDSNSIFFSSEDFFLTKAKYIFEVKQGFCNLPGKCGFILEVSSKDRNPLTAKTFKIELCTEASDYNAKNLHYHGDRTSADTIHLILMVRCNNLTYSHLLCGLSWNEKGLHHVVAPGEASFIWKLGDLYEIKPKQLLKLAAYVDL